MPGSPTRSATGPLSGIRVVDLTQNLSGPMATMILGDQGADVIKIEPPGIGDFTRAMGGTKRGVAPGFAVINRNKRSVALNLRDPRGLELLKRLIAGADLFVQNHRPGVAERMGIGEAALRAVKPDLVYVSISGFGESGPYADQRVYDPVIQALSGLAAIQADVETGHPHMIRLIIPDKVTALTAAQAMTAALFARQRTGEGQHVRLAMLDAVIAFLWPEGMAAYTFSGTNRGQHARGQGARAYFRNHRRLHHRGREYRFRVAGDVPRAGAAAMARRRALQIAGRPDPQRRRAPRDDRRSPEDQKLRRLARTPARQPGTLCARAQP